MKNCGFCHSCGTKLRPSPFADDWCDHCKTERRYRSHGWAVGAAERDTFGCFRTPEDAARQQRVTDGDMITSPHGSKMRGAVSRLIMWTAGVSWGAIAALMIDRFSYVVIIVS